VTERLSSSIGGGARARLPANADVVPAPGPHPGVEDAFAQHRRFLWAVCYRMTGCAADADDLVQATFVRAIERPPHDLDEPWRPWLTRVAMNLGRDLLRRRRRRGYVGPWLPSPIESDEAELAAYEPRLAGGGTTEGRYDLVESVSYAFLLALEALTPKQRAVLLLRDVFDYTVQETADALALSEPDVKTTHHRARRAMAAYDRERCQPTRERRERTQEALTSFLAALVAGDGASAERLLASSVRALSDGGGEFFAARVPVVGRDRVLKFYGNISRRIAGGMRAEIRLLNGMPAIVAEIPRTGDGFPTFLVTRAEVDGDGKIRELHSVLATRKLTAVRRIDRT
jgi:RNA polymerase sigma-70 factor (ECF subfamily)